MGLSAERTNPARDRRTNNSSTASNNVTLGSGFVLTSSNSDYAGVVSDDPMVQQIRNLRGFIQEARRLGRRDEVAALEDNLRELQAEYKRGQDERREMEDNYHEYKGLFHKTSPSKGSAGAAVASAVASTDAPASPEAVDIDEYDASGKNPFFDDE